MSVPGTGPTLTKSSNTLNDRRNTLQSYLHDLLMIPSIKESNQLKAFLGFKEHYPQFYNFSMDKIVTKDKEFFSINLKDFQQLEKPKDLQKFITKAVPKIESPQRHSKTNTRYKQLDFVMNEEEEDVRQPPSSVVSSRTQNTLKKPKE